MKQFKKFYKRLKRKLIPPFYKELAMLVESFDQHAGEAPGILYFGDSVLERVSWNDNDTSTLGEMVSTRLKPNYNVCVISRTAYHPSIFLSLGQVLKITQKRPNLLILPINIRCFSPQWDWEPLWQYDREILAIEKFCNDPFRRIPRLVPSNKLTSTHHMQNKFLKRTVKYPLTNFTRIGHFKELIATKPTETQAINHRWRQIIIYHYLHPLRSDNQKLRNMQKLIKLMHEMDILVFSYITPINYQAGKRIVGEEFTHIVSNNIATIFQAITGCQKHICLGCVWNQHRLVVADWSTMLSENFFFHNNDPTEHLNEKGRSSLADAIVKLVNNLVRKNVTESDGGGSKNLDNLLGSESAQLERS